MRLYVDRLKAKLREEQGLTLIELIAVLTILSVVMGLIYSTITFGLNAYHKVRIENSLRDEGDLIMSSIITELYTFGPEIIEQEQGNTSSILLKSRDQSAQNLDAVEKSEAVAIKGETQKSLYIGNEEIGIDSDLSGSVINLDCQGLAACSSGLIQIKLKLKQSYGGKDHELMLESKFGF
ncbi:type II secretion system protein [Paenibacillus nasutitermitis]|uniref:Prepilin-type N-terminal cleavage/methylation domain-containing protein n=1 Tax=Paenibacillus nasutitermitis TaxID=1652958 RepID=A0A917DKM5_9BACL|nr:prepilin-type N-terminal cleavage/methylation domain-containing protein [Paenibacillus nasutitermitis]GGD47957.1 hypothetical protein GCM10010911_01870 [Paenibacillus nasutitermitis]